MVNTAKIQHYSMKGLKSQRGAIVLTVSIIFLLLTTFVTLYSTKVILLEQKMTSNTERSKLAFEAAEYGITMAFQYLNDGADRDKDGDVDGGSAADGGAGIFNIVDGIGTARSTSVGNESVSVTIEEIDIDPDLILAVRIVSQGFSDDQSATRTITQVIKVVDALPNLPDNPLTAKGTVTVNGSATVHNPEGASTIWSGGDVDVGSNNSTATYVADPGDADYPTCMEFPGKENVNGCDTVQTSNMVTLGLDIIEHDSNLANLSPEQMFENFFGMTIDKYKEAVVTLEIASPNAFPGVIDSGSQVIWYDGPLALNGGSIGCSVAVTGGNTCAEANETPSIIIIDGNADMSGSPHFYGIVFVMGNITLSGNTTVHGAMIVAGDTNSASGSLDIHYNSRLLQLTKEIPDFAAATGGWRDF